MAASLSFRPKASAAEKKGVAAEVKPLPVSAVPVGVTHINLRAYVMAHPHAAKLRKRQRYLKPVKPSHADELHYRAKLQSIVNVMKNHTNNVLIPELQRVWGAERVYIGDAAKMQVSAPIRAALAAARKQTQNIDAVARKTVDLFIKRNIRSVDDRLSNSISRSLGVNIRPAFTNEGPIRDKMAAFLKTNIGLITSIPEQYHERIEDMVEKNYLSGKRFSALESDLKQVGNITDNRAHLIARDQTSKMNAAFSMVRMQSVGINEYRWQTAEDERVRETHADNQGQIFSFDEPPEETGNPGDDINCRCFAEPYFDLDAMEAAASEE